MDISRLFGDRIRESTTLRRVVLLDRTPGEPPFRRLNPEAGLRYMLEKDFCNPHQLVRDPRKMELRKMFFRELFGRVELYMLNTIETPHKSLERLKNLEE